MSAPPGARWIGCASVALIAALSAPAHASPGQVVRVEHYDPSTTPSRGPATALVTAEVFFAPMVNGNVRIPVLRLLEQLADKHPTRMRVIYRIVVRGAQPPGPQLPTLALEAYAEGKFFEFVAAIHGTRTTALTREQMIDVGRKLGLDPGRLDRAISDDRYRDVISANDHRLERLRGTSAPAVFFNDKPIRASSEKDVEAAYKEAYDRALDLLDRGIDPRGLAEAFDAEILQSTPPVVVTAGPTDDDGGGDPKVHPLANPPLDLTSLPSLARPGGGAEVPVVVLCRPNDANCSSQMRIVRRVQENYRDEVRIVWAPWFDVTRDDAADLSLLGDAALCAEAVGSSPDDLDSSPGWQWVSEMYTQLGRSHGRRVPPDKLIDGVAAKLHVDGRQLSACRARMANTTLDFIAAARHSGVSRSPAMVIGGRIYEGLSDQAIIQALVEAELAPGVLGEVAPAWRATSK